MSPTFTRVNTPGPVGPAGPAGTVNMRGAWSSGATYAQGDMVTYSNAAYLALKASGPDGAAVTPGTDPTTWQAMGGLPGATGDAGAGFGTPTPNTTSLTPAAGNKTFTSVPAGMAWATGMPIQATSASTPGSYMAGTVYSYSSTTLVITVTAYAGATKADWVFSAPTGPQGPPGTTGEPGATGPAATPVPPYMSSLITGPDTSKTISGATHGIATAALLVMVYDNSTPRNAISAGWTVDPTSYDVVITFAVAQSNYYVVINGGGSPGTSGGAPSGTGMVAVTSGVPRLATANTDYMPAIAGIGLLMVGKVTPGALGLATPTVDYQPALGFTPVDAASKGAASGVCGLDGSALVPVANLPPTALGGAGSYSARNYKFSAIAPGGILTVGSNIITLPGLCPAGLNGSDTNHYIRISAGTGTAEAVLITGGSCTAGSSGRTLTFTCAYAHSGAWTITSASDGIQECIIDASAHFNYAPGTWIRLTGSSGSESIYNVYAPIYVPYTFWFDGGAIAMYGPTLIAFDVNVQNDWATNVIFQNMTFWGAQAGVQTAGSCAIRFGNTVTGRAARVFGCVFKDQYDAVVVDVNASDADVYWNKFYDFLHTGITSNPTSDTCQLAADHNFYLNSGLGSPALAGVWIKGGAAQITNEMMAMNDSSQLQNGILGNWTASSSGMTIEGNQIGYFSVAGISLTVTGAVLFQYVSIVGNTIHNEDYTSASKGIVCSVASGGTLADLHIGGNQIQGPSGHTFTAIDTTGCTAVTLGVNNITNATTYYAPARVSSLSLIVGSVYQNTSGNSLQISAEFHGTLAFDASLLSDGSNPPTTTITRIGSTVNLNMDAVLIGVVAPGNYYKLSTTGSPTLNYTNGTII